MEVIRTVQEGKTPCLHMKEVEKRQKQGKLLCAAHPV